MGTVNDTTPCLEAHFVVVDFETLTPKGRPPEPLEVAALHIGPGLKVDSDLSVDWLIRPPDDVPITDFDTAQTGIRWEDVHECPRVDDIMTAFDTKMTIPECMLVAQNAKYEAAIIQRFAHACPKVAQLPVIDTVALARHLIPGLANYKLDTLAAHCGVLIPENRHRALPDVQVTVGVFTHLVRLGMKADLRTIGDLIRVAGIGPKGEKQPAQGSLF